MNDLVNIDIAQQQLLDAVSPITHTETVSLLQGYGRVLTQDYYSDQDVPPAANSAMDGYAVNTVDCALGAELLVSQRIAAGSKTQPLIAGTAARIFTGAEIPAGANAVIIQENCTVADNKIILNAVVTEKDNIRPQGQDIVKGSLLFSRGHFLRAQDVALLSSVSIHNISVYKKLRVAFLSTGNELVEPGNSLEAGQIYNSNRYLLAGLLQQLNCEIYDLGIVKDSLTATTDALTKAASADLIISSGGVSVGEEDHVKAAVSQLGSLNLWKLNLKPGKPLAFGFVKNTPFVGLPGNPVSAFVTFELLVKNLIHKLQGRLPEAHKIELHPAQFNIPIARKRCEFLRAIITATGVELFPQQSSGALSSVVWADCLVRIDEGVLVKQGDLVKTYRLK